MSKKILIIEDDEPVLETLKEILISKGYIVNCASTASGALKELDNIDAPDWIVMDYEIQGLNPEGFVNKIKLVYPTSKIILSSGYSEFEISKEFKLSSVDSFVEKPFSPSELIKQLS